MTMLTDAQRILLSQLIDASWELKEMRAGVVIETAPTSKLGEIVLQLNKVEKIENEMKDSMGLEAYESFMNKGRQMFKSKTD